MYNMNILFEGYTQTKAAKVPDIFHSLGVTHQHTETVEPSCMLGSLSLHAKPVWNPAKLQGLLIARNAFKRQQKQFTEHTHSCAISHNEHSQHQGLLFCRQWHALP